MSRILLLLTVACPAVSAVEEDSLVEMPAFMDRPLLDIIHQQGQVMESMNRKLGQLTETVHLQGKQIQVMEKQMTEMNIIIQSQRQDLRSNELDVKVLQEAVKNQTKMLAHMEQEQLEQYKTVRKLEEQVATCTKKLSTKDENELVSIYKFHGGLAFPPNPDLVKGFKSKKNISTALWRTDSNKKRNQKTENRKDYMAVNSNLSQAGKSDPKTMKRAAPSALPINRTGIAFYAYASHHYDHLSKGHIIKSDQVTLNDGNGYNKHTGVFTVPQSGVYLLTFTFEGYHLSQPVEVELLVDDINYGSATTESSSSFDMSGKTVILHLTAGQSVWLQTVYYADASIHSNSFNRLTSFAGVLLY